MIPEAPPDNRLNLQDAQDVASALFLLNEIGISQQPIEEHGKVQTAGDAVLRCVGFARSLVDRSQDMEDLGASEQKIHERIKASVIGHATDKIPDQVKSTHNRAPILKIDDSAPSRKKKR